MLDHLSYQSVLILVFFHFLSALSWSSVLFNLSLCFCHSTPLSLYILPYTPLTSSPVSLSLFFLLFFSASSTSACLFFFYLSMYLPSHVPSPLLPLTALSMPHLTSLLSLAIPFTLLLLSPSSFACSAVGSWDGATMCSTGDGTG